MARQLTDNAVYQYAVQQNTPKSTLEYFGRTVADMNVINSISKGLARSQAGTSATLQLMRPLWVSMARITE
ncbi:hypothetical protein [Duncaniella muris]|uniref:hypothetical protein n=1 Tax=Duncaniella muris TaxID=2094150 RepID=UPI003F663D98